jgi:hypothetical protein
MSALPTPKPEKTLGIAEWDGPQPGDPHPIIYFSGIPKSAQATEEDFLRVGVRHRCLSYAYCGTDTGLFSQENRKALDFCMTHGVRVFLDSGAHTFHNVFFKGKKLPNLPSGVDKLTAIKMLVAGYVERYAKFVCDYQAKYGRFAFYVNFDYEKGCAAIFRVLRDLYRLGIRPIPVYHGNETLEWMERYIDDGHKLIGISWSHATQGGNYRRQYYDRVFNLAAKHNVYLHGFAQTGRAAFAYPWYSVDSSSWLKVAAFGSIVDTVPTANGRLRLRVLHVSDVMANAGKANAFALKNLPKPVLRDLEDRVAKKGFELRQLCTSLTQRGLYNAKTFVDISNQYKVQNRGWGRLL